MAAGRHRRTAPQRRARRVTETSEFAAFLTRTLYAYGHRVGGDPAALVHLRDLESTFRDAVNLGVYLANQGADHYGINSIAAMLGVSKQAVHKRVKLGEAVYVRLEAAKAAGPVVRLGDFRQARAAELARLSIPDVTGSDKERATAAWASDQRTATR